MPKLSLEAAKKISPKVLLRLIQRAKDHLKKNDVFKDLCKEYDVEPNILDLIPIKFGDLDVSARTAHGIITLNYKLLCDGDFLRNSHYIIHEADHYLQQCFGDRPTKGADDGDYLSNPYEVDAFQKQIKYIDDEFGDDEAEKYTEHLLDHHDKEGKERENKKEDLMKEVK